MKFLVALALVAAAVAESEPEADPAQVSLLPKILGTAPTLAADGAFTPSKYALSVGTVAKTDFDGGAYENPYNGGIKLRILMVCTQDRNMVMANGKQFSTGHNPVEMGLPMLHLINAGFKIDVVTPTGAPAIIEQWSMPEDDEAVKKLFGDFDHALKNPGSLKDFVANSMTDDSPYLGVFLPGGHGAMLGLPDNPDVGKLLRWAHKRGLYTMAICHGPAALLAAKEEGKDFIYDGYKVAAYPDAYDKQAPMIGYLPGPMTWMMGEKLKALGTTVINEKADNTCHIDRNLISGASPAASNDFGRLAAKTLLEATRS